ncbi:hypothetical protein L2D14_01415 [Thalassospiraceae bacterium LMO-JJ14]|nr:hypothetical protein L2D14_01415 [Thalassospiraceae bacterium LMO-JJ14]
MKSEPEVRVRRAARKPPLETARDVLGKSLPVSIRHALQNYRGVAFADPPSDAKEFQQHQAACKAALQHIEALLKLAGIVDAPAGKVPAAGHDTASLLARAEATVDAYAKTDDNQQTRE